MKPITRGTLRTRCHVVHPYHLDQDVAREKLALTLALLASAHLDHFFGRDQHFTEQSSMPCILICSRRDLATRPS
jgi:hypothetical protein